MEREKIKHYSNGEITIVWKPSTCIHSTMCWKKGTGLPEVFDPRSRPWIKPEGAETSKIIEHIQKCPSGALSYFFNDKPKEEVSVSSDTRVEALLNGPLLVYGNITLKDSAGTEIKKSNVTAFCRCGHSGNKPYCDGSHLKHNFNG